MNIQLAINNNRRLSLVTDLSEPSTSSAETNVMPMARKPLYLVSNSESDEERSLSCANGVCLLTWRPKRKVA